MIEQFANVLAAPATLAAAISSTATSCTVSNAGNFSSLSAGQQFRMVIQDTPTSEAELVLVTATSGATFTIQRGIEGSTASAHVSGASVAQILTAYHMQNCFPQPPRVVTASGTVTILPGDQIVEIAQSSPAACAVSVDPTALIPGKLYTIKDGGFNSATYPITMTPLSGNIDGESNYVLNEDGGSIDFYTTGVNLRVK